MDKEYYENMIKDFKDLKGILNPMAIQIIELEIGQREIVKDCTSPDLLKIKDETEKSIERNIETEVERALEKIHDDGGQNNGL